jgi:hypothetical protein
MMKGSVFFVVRTEYTYVYMYNTDELKIQRVKVLSHDFVDGTEENHEKSQHRQTLG